MDINTTAGDAGFNKLKCREEHKGIRQRFILLLREKMSMKIALISCLLILIPAGGLGCGGGSSGGSSSGGSSSGGSSGVNVPSCCPESKSPSGGPSRNKGAAVCYFRRNSLRLECIKGSSKYTCSAVRAASHSENVQKGPTPYGEYLIGKHRLSTRYRGLNWYNLYPKKEDNTGYYGYNQPNRKGRSAMGIHPGQVSWGCVTVSAPGCSSSYSCYNSNWCWRKIKSIINSGNMYYRGSSYSGILYVVP